MISTFAALIHKYSLKTLDFETSGAVDPSALLLLKDLGNFLLESLCTDKFNGLFGALIAREEAVY